jgi:8-oxo-dGTP pyrophosphatase MutT (NUDIX family)
MCHTPPVTDPRIGSLLHLLAGHTPAGDGEAAHLARLVALLQTAPQPFDRDLFVPGHVTASGFVVDRDGERLLLIHHRRLGIWVQPGGHLDPGDAGPDAAARREIAEETGLGELERHGDGVLDVDVHAYPARSADPAHEHFDVRFGYRALHGALRPNDEVHDARWVGAGDLAALGADASILRPAGKLLRTP